MTICPNCGDEHNCKIWDSFCSDGCQAEWVNRGQKAQPGAF